MKNCGKCGKEFTYTDYRLIDGTFKKDCLSKKDDIQNLCIDCLSKMAKDGSLKLKNSDNYADMITGKIGAVVLQSCLDERYELDKDNMIELLKDFDDSERLYEFKKRIHQNYGKGKNKYKIAISYQKCGYVDVYGKDLTEALSWAKDHIDDFELSDDDEYIDGSYEIDEESTIAAN